MFKPNNIHATSEDLYSFYTKTNLNHTNENVDTQQNDETEVLSNEQINENEINQPITEDEMIMAAKSLKSNKTRGVDNIINEHLKSTVNTMLPVYLKLFNLIY